MSAQPECPRGHLLEENAVYCTVCWMRVVPEDPIAVAARQRRRRRVWFPLFGAGAVVLGVVTGIVLEQTTHQAPTDAVVAEGTPPDGTPAPEATTPSTDALAVTAVPLAGTVADPAVPAAAACTVDLRDQQLECATEGGQLSFTACVPAGTAMLEARTRSDGGVPWVDVSTVVVVRADAACDDGLAADVSIDAAAAGRDGATWRLVARDSGGERLWKSAFTAQSE